MAALRVIQEQPDRIVLGKGGGSAIGSLIGLGVFGVVTAIALSAILEEGGEFNPVMIVVFFVIGLAVLGGLVNTVSGTTVVLNGNQRTATRTRTLFFFPISRQEMSFNLIREVEVTRAQTGTAAFTLDALPIWQVELKATDGSSLLVNERGSRAEMDALAARVGGVLNRPVRTEQATRPQTATNSSPTAVMTSLIENLAVFAQSAGSATATPPIAASSSTGPRLQQDDAERAGRPRQHQPHSPAIPPNTFSTNRPQVNPDAPFLQVSQDLAADQEAFASSNAANAPSSSFTAPPVLVMPELPGMLSFGPALEMPSFPALGSMMPAPAAPTYPTAEIKEVVSQVTSDTPNDSLTLYRNARQMYSMRNFTDAQRAYLTALGTNPADPAIQNDLGVVYFAQNKMQDAERSFRRAIALDPFFNAARYNLGMVLRRRGHKTEAYEQFKLGAQNATRADAENFNDALRGTLREPQLSPL